MAGENLGIDNLGIEVMDIFKHGENKKNYVVTCPEGVTETAPRRQIGSAFDKKKGAYPVLWGIHLKLRRAASQQARNT